MSTIIAAATTTTTTAWGTFGFRLTVYSLETTPGRRPDPVYNKLSLPNKNL